MNLQLSRIFPDGGHLTGDKLKDFRSQLRSVGTSKTKEASTPIFKTINETEKPVAARKPISLEKQNTIPESYRNRPLPTPIVKEKFETNRKSISLEKQNTIPEAYRNRPLPTPIVKENLEVSNPLHTPSEEEENLQLVKVVKVVEEENNEIVKSEKLASEHAIVEVKPETAQEPNFVVRSAKAVGEFAKKILYKIKNFFDAVFGKLFGRVTKIKIAGKEIAFDGDEQSKGGDRVSENRANVKIQLDEVAADTFKAIGTIGNLAAKNLPTPSPSLNIPTPPPLPEKNWRPQRKNKVQEPERKAEGKDSQGLVKEEQKEQDVKKQEKKGESLADVLAEGLKHLRELQNPDEKEDNDSTFEITFTRDDGKQTNLSFDGDQTVEIETEIGDQKPKVYNDLNKKQEQKSNVEVISDNVLKAARNNLNKFKKSFSQPKCSDQDDIGHVLLRGFMKNASNLLPNMKV